VQIAREAFGLAPANAGVQNKIVKAIVASIAEILFIVKYPPINYFVSLLYLSFIVRSMFIFSLIITFIILFSY